MADILKLELPRDLLEFVWIVLDHFCDVTKGEDGQPIRVYLDLARRFKPSRWTSKGRSVDVTEREVMLIAQLVLLMKRHYPEMSGIHTSAAQLAPVLRRTLGPEYERSTADDADSLIGPLTNIDNGWILSEDPKRFSAAIHVLRDRGAEAESAEATITAVCRAASRATKSGGAAMSIGELVAWSVTDLVKHGIERNQAGDPSETEVQQLLAFVRRAMDAAIEVGLVTRNFDRE